MKEVYEHTSGYVHLSDKAFFNAIGDPSKDSEYNLKISADDVYVPEEAYLDALYTFFKITGVLFSYLQGWVISKENAYNKINDST